MSFLQCFVFLIELLCFIWFVAYFLIDLFIDEKVINRKNIFPVFLSSTYIIWSFVKMMKWYSCLFATLIIEFWKIFFISKLAIILSTIKKKIRCLCFWINCLVFWIHCGSLKLWFTTINNYCIFFNLCETRRLLCSDVLGVSN